MTVKGTILKALVALMVIMLGTNFNAEAQLGGLIGAAKDLATQKGAKIPKQKKKGKPIAFTMQGATVGSFDPTTLTITFNQKDNNGQQIVYKIDPNTGAVTSHLGNSVGSMSNDGSFESPKLGKLTVEESTYPNFKVKKDGKVIGGVTTMKASNSNRDVIGQFAEEVSPLLVAYVYFGVLVSDDQASALASGFGSITTEELEDYVKWTDRYEVNQVNNFESSRPNAGWDKAEHPEFKNLKVAAIGLGADKWANNDPYFSKEKGDWLYGIGYWMPYYAVYELADGRNIAMFATVVKKSQYADIKSRIDARFFIITDWQRK
ncbi:MAG: hypothetical protein J6T60_05610 [Bacteroidales bacterium]|nr:hypothetical protein [Bacteroidales bacterium]